jgi:N utilization substance protein B
MAVVDRNVLRMALHELLSGTSPAAVVINEAVEIAKRFGGEGSGAFVNGLLDSMRASLERESDAAPRPTGS